MRTIVVARDLRNFDSALSSLGYTRNRVFFKILDVNTHALYGGSHSKYAPISPYEHLGDFLHLERIYETIPENTAHPIALVLQQSPFDLMGSITQLVVGATLQTHLRKAQLARRNGSNLSAEYGDLISRLGVAVARLHAYGIAHGDISEMNVMVSQSREIKLIDPIAHANVEFAVDGDRQNLARMLKKAHRL